MIRSGPPGLSPYLKVNWFGTLITSAKFFTVVPILVFDWITGCYTGAGNLDTHLRILPTTGSYTIGHEIQQSININC